jgi:two-component system CheB/CheR fusion protein
VPLNLEYIQSIALAVHELATNDVKYGSFTSQTGHLSVRWTVDQNGDASWLVLVWKESGRRVPPVSSRRGYGRQLIEQALAFTLWARTELRFEPDGVHCRIELPLARASAIPTTERRDKDGAVN